MIPLTLLPQISPAAAKVYLVLVCAHRTQPDNRLPIITISLDMISQLAALSRRTCTFALQDLANLKLLRRLPRRYHAPQSFLLLKPQAQPAAPLTPSQAQPTAPYTQSPAQPIAPLPSQTPAHAPKNPIAQPIAPLLNPLGPTHPDRRPSPVPDPESRTPEPAPSDPADPALIHRLYLQLSEPEKALIISLAQAQLAKPAKSPREARP